MKNKERFISLLAWCAIAFYLLRQVRIPSWNWVSYGRFPNPVPCHCPASYSMNAFVFFFGSDMMVLFSAVALRLCKSIYPTRFYFWLAIIQLFYDITTPWTTIYLPDPFALKIGELSAMLIFALLSIRGRSPQ